MKWATDPWAAPHEPVSAGAPYERREYTACYTDGTRLVEAFNAYARDAGGRFHKRDVDHFEADGMRYEPVGECVLTRTYEGEPCSDWTCSACGKTHCVHNAAKVSEFCPRCGNKVTGVEMDPWNAAAADPEMRNGT